MLDQPHPHSRPVDDASSTFRRWRVLWPGLVILLLASLFVVGGQLYQRWQNFSAPGPLQQARTIDIIPGMGLMAISGLLQTEGIIDDALLFRVLSEWRGVAHRLRAGHYRFAAGVSAEEVLEMLQRGRTYLYPLTLSEGLTSRQIVEIVNTHPHFSGALIAELEEATLLPETYRFEKGISRQSALETMRKAWQDSVEGLWETRAEGVPLKNLQEAIILASIVEREAVGESELGTIAGVFHNRLRRKMRLQSDPTVIYALTEGAGRLDRRLLRKDWQYEHPYNTYRIDGLPPGPIGHPSLAALRAVLNPEQHEYVFFVADGKGGHRFARTYAEHRENVKKWIAQREQSAGLSSADRRQGRSGLNRNRPALNTQG